MRFDVWTGMFFSNAVMFFIIAACAATLFAHGITNIQTADQAAAALEPFAGQWAFALFALGIIGTGFSGGAGAWPAPRRTQSPKASGSKRACIAS